MKSVLYVAATLMIGASIYGFVDYNKTSRQKEFKTMYDETDPVPEEKKIVTVITPEPVIKKDQPEVTTEEPVQQPVKKVKKKRTINYESFSRAPLREKRETVIVEIKDQKEKEQ